MSDKLTLTKLELLRMARELVINEYIDKRAQDHNAWLAQADVVWRTQGVRLAYPIFPQYPTEVDILTRARTLNTFLSAEDQPQEKISAVPATEVAAVVSVAQADNTLPVEVLTQSNVVDVRAEDVKDITPPAPTNYVSKPEIFGDILNKPTPQITDPAEQPMSALDRLKSSLGLK